MTRLLTLAAFAALCSAPLAAQSAAAPIAPSATPSAASSVAPTPAPAAAPSDLPAIPAVAAYAHWGQIEQTYDDDDNSTSISLSLPFNDDQRDAFIRRGATRRAELSAGFVYAGKTLTSYPDIVTVMLKVTRPTEAALRGDREGNGDIAFTLGGGSAPVSMPASLVTRSGMDLEDGRPRNVQDTYVIIMTLRQFLNVVDAPTATAQLHDMKLQLTGGPLEGLRDLASRIIVAQ